MQNFIRRPSIDLVPGIRVTKDTELEFKNENVTQSVRGMMLHTISKVAGDGYESKCDTFIRLEEGDVLLFEEDGRGYIKPVDSFVSIAEAIEDLESIKGLEVMECLQSTRT
jgi:hypothetical protein